MRYVDDYDVLHLERSSYKLDDNYLRRNIRVVHKERLQKIAKNWPSLPLDRTMSALAQSSCRVDTS